MRNKFVLIFLLLITLAGLWYSGTKVEATVYPGNRISNFIGLSTDTKPTGLSGAGQTFYEIDTSLFSLNLGIAIQVDDRGVPVEIADDVPINGSGRVATLPLRARYWI